MPVFPGFFGRKRYAENYRYPLAKTGCNGPKRGLWGLFWALLGPFLTPVAANVCILPFLGNQNHLGPIKSDRSQTKSLKKISQSKPKWTVMGQNWGLAAIWGLLGTISDPVALPMNTIRCIWSFFGGPLKTPCDAMNGDQKRTATFEKNPGCRTAWKCINPLPKYRRPLGGLFATSVKIPFGGLLFFGG